MGGMHDVADLTNGLVEWVQSVCPDAAVQVAQGTSKSDDTAPDDGDSIFIRLVRFDATSGARSGDAVASKMHLEYSFDVAFADAVAGQQALADLAFGLLDRDDLGERGEVARGENGALSATFVLHRRRDLPRAKPVHEAVINLHPQSQVAGFVEAENGFRIARARVQVRNSDRLIITGNEGEFAFAAPEGIPVRATVSAKGRSTEVDLKPGDPNIVFLAMET